MFSISLKNFLAPNIELETILLFCEHLELQFNCETIISGGFVRDMVLGVQHSDIDIYCFDVEIETQDFKNILSKIESIPGIDEMKYFNRADLDNSKKEYAITYPEKLQGMIELLLNGEKVQVMFWKSTFDMDFFNSFCYGTSTGFIKNKVMYFPNMFINDIANKQFKVRNDKLTTIDGYEYYKLKMKVKFPNFKFV